MTSAPQPSDNKIFGGVLLLPFTQQDTRSFSQMLVYACPPMSGFWVNASVSWSFDDYTSLNTTDCLMLCPFLDLMEACASMKQACLELHTKHCFSAVQFYYQLCQVVEYGSCCCHYHSCCAVLCCAVLRCAVLCCLATAAGVLLVCSMLSMIHGPGA